MNIILIGFTVMLVLLLTLMWRATIAKQRCSARLDDVLAENFTLKMRLGLIK